MATDECSVSLRKEEMGVGIVLKKSTSFWPLY